MHGPQAKHVQMNSMYLTFIQEEIVRSQKLCVWLCVWVCVCLCVYLCVWVCVCVITKEKGIKKSERKERDIDGDRLKETEKE